jgi:hypothetical protein
MKEEILDSLFLNYLGEPIRKWLIMYSMKRSI